MAKVDMATLKCMCTPGIAQICRPKTVSAKVYQLNHRHFGEKKTPFSKDSFSVSEINYY